MSLKIKSIILSIAVMFSFNYLEYIIPVSSYTAQPFYDNTNEIILSLNFSGGNAYCSGTINGKNGSTSINNCNVYLKNSSGTVVRSWTNLSSNSSTLEFDKVAYGISKGTYTLSVTVVVNIPNCPSELVIGSETNTYR